ncbi:unnamed protein product, partial [Effrenium voratum]
MDPGEDQVKLASDWTMSMDILLTELRVKTNHWCCLPWKLAAIALPDAEEARKAAREALALWDDDSMRRAETDLPTFAELLRTEPAWTLADDSQVFTEAKVANDGVDKGPAPQQAQRR